MALQKRIFMLVLSMLMLFGATASYADKDTNDVIKTYTLWIERMQQAHGNPKGVVSLYAPDAVLIATFSEKPLFNKYRELDKYFASLTSNKNMRIVTNLLMTRVYDKDAATNAGLYTFIYTDNKGKEVRIPARFTFTYAKEHGQWVIVEHHSSLVPKPLK